MRIRIEGVMGCDRCNREEVGGEGGGCAYCRMYLKVPVA